MSAVPNTRWTAGHVREDRGRSPADGCYGEDGERAIGFEHPDTLIPEE
jgi:hypothetical protein